MAYNREITDAAMAVLERRRAQANARAAALRERMRAKYPRVVEIEREMAGAARQVARAVLDGGDVDAAVEAIKQRNLALQAELAELLAREGEPVADFEPVYTCPVCRDTGYTGGRRCVCLEGLLKEEACRRLNESTPMGPARFEDMTLTYYPDTPDPRTGKSPRAHMRGVLDYCRYYADDFGNQTPSLLLRGPTGTGKTHAALAIAQRVAAKGCGVVYGPAQVLLHRLEKEHFGREEGNSEDLMAGCDLLILDDLGTEFTSPFYVSCIYNLVNTRLLAARPTIISTNLREEELLDRYGEAITSRLIGQYMPLAFIGRDIRQIKLRERIGGNG